MQWTNGLGLDVWHALAGFRRNPGFAIAASLVVALGVGTCAAVFAIVNQVLLKPLPYRDADRLVVLMNVWRGHPDSAPGVSTPKFLAWQRTSTGLEDASACALSGVMTVGIGSRMDEVPAGRVTAGFFHLLDAAPVRGRTFSDQDDRPGSPRVVVVSDGFWRRALGGERDAIGTTLVLNDERYELIGILEPSFTTRFLPASPAHEPELWIPLQLDERSRTDANYLIAIGRLGSQISLANAQAQTHTAEVGFREQFPSLMPAENSWRLESLREVAVRDLRPSLLLLLLAVSLVLLVASANLAGLLLTREAGRSRDMAIRVAIGASAGRIWRQLLTESLLLALCGGIIGGAVAAVGIAAMAASFADTLSPLLSLRGLAVPDWRLLLFTWVVVSGTGIVSGLAPAVRAAGIDVDAELKSHSGSSTAGRSRRTIRSLLVVGEITLAVALLAGSMLLLRSFVILRQVNPGFDSTRVVVGRTAVLGRRFESPDGLALVLRDGLRRIRALPEVDVAAATLTGLPLEGATGFLNVGTPGLPADLRRYAFGWNLVSPGYFDTLRIPLWRGRLFTDRDDSASPPVAIVNAAMAKMLWADADALKAEVVIAPGAGQDLEESVPRSIVGIVGDVRQQGLNRDPRPAVYVPLLQIPANQTSIFNRLGGHLTWVVRVRDDSWRVRAAIQDQLRSAGGGLPSGEIRSMNYVAEASTADRRFDVWLMAFFAASTLLLASVGVFGVMASSVRQRTRELGIRLALGARPVQLRRMVLKDALYLTLPGVAIGIAAAFSLSHLMAGFLFGVTAHDPITFAVVPLVLGAAALSAAWFPARRAAASDPAITLRSE